ncbi:MAG: endonuclease/exonuclease/phosphatase family protein, partial [Duncaniella sp.]|nr:endonuclease/exonuclease/phosphatase family protein [Duncaniella sp.]
PMDRSVAQNLGAGRDDKKVTAHGFFNPWWNMLAKGIGTLAYKGGWNLFDQIVVSGTLLKQNQGEKGLHYWKCQVNNFEFLRDTNGQRQGYPLRTFSGGVWLDGYSDHFPTEVFLIKAR